MLTSPQSYHEGHGQAYKNYGIDPKVGAAVILRPDQYVSWVGDFDDYESMDRFFSGFMLTQQLSSGDVAPKAGKGPAQLEGVSNGIAAGDEAAKGTAAA